MSPSNEWDLGSGSIRLLKLERVIKKRYCNFHEIDVMDVSSQACDVFGRVSMEKNSSSILVAKSFSLAKLTIVNKLEPVGVYLGILMSELLI
ncbi:hypothetical protein WAI453_009995 [Rhynchosporium graminicola]